MLGAAFLELEVLNYKKKSKANTGLDTLIHFNPFLLTVTG